MAYSDVEVVAQIMDMIDFHHVSPCVYEIVTIRMKDAGLFSPYLRKMRALGALSEDCLNSMWTSADVSTAYTIRGIINILPFDVQRPIMDYLKLVGISEKQDGALYRGETLWQGNFPNHMKKVEPSAVPAGPATGLLTVALTPDQWSFIKDITKSSAGPIQRSAWANFPRYVRRPRIPLAPVKKDNQLSDAELSIIREIMQKRKEAVEEILVKLTEATA